MPVFSIIIVCFNNRDIIGPCIDSIQSTVDRSRYEIIVSDNGSTDGSRDFLRQRYPEVIVIENGRNLGFAAAVNRGIARSTGTYVVLMNSDARLTPGALEKIAEFMDGHRDTGVAGGGLMDSDGSLQNSAAAYPGIATEFGLKSVLKLFSPRRFPGKVREDEPPLDVDSIIGALMVVRMKAINRVGMLDEDFFFFLEETDWCLRMKRAGWRVVVVPSARIMHYQGKTAKRYNLRSKVEYYRSLMTYMKKNRPRLYAWLFSIGLPVKFMVNLLLNVFVCCLTLFLSRGPRKRCVKYAGLVAWFFAGCPVRWGLTGIEAVSS